MKAAMLVGPGKIEIQEIEKPKIKYGEVLVRTENCGICTLEQRLFCGDMKIYYPIVPGHEASGEIVEVADGVLNAYEPGMRVALDLVTRCGECYYCRTGQSNMCSNRFNKGQRVLGGFAEYIPVKATQIFRIPDHLTYREAAFAEPVACCVRSLRKIGVTLGEDVLIVGAGPMGLMHLQVANCMGARVFVSDPNTERLGKAGKLGAYKVIDPSSEDLKKIILEKTEKRGVDACVITSPAAAALTSTFEIVSKTGRVNIYTSYFEKLPLPIDANTLHRNEYFITGSEGRTEVDFHQAVRLLSFGKVNVESLISKIVGFHDLEDGIRAATTYDTYRVLLEHRK